MSLAGELRAVTAAATRRVTRNRVVQRWGTPQVSVGSVNEPREQEEHGLRFNEKWIYRNPRGEGAPAGEPLVGHVRERIVYWQRYDFVGSMVTDATGRLEHEEIERLLAQLDDRRYLPLSP